MPGPEELDDVDALWELLVRARRDGDDEAVARVRARMGVLERRRRLAQVSDADLDRRIRALEESLRVEPIRHSGVTEDSITNQHADAINERMLAAAADRDEAAQLAWLREERRRREGGQ